MRVCVFLFALVHENRKQVQGQKQTLLLWFIVPTHSYTTSDTVFFITRSEGNFMDLIFGLALDSGGFAPASMMQMDENEQRQSVAGECENIILSCSRMHSF